MEYVIIAALFITLFALVARVDDKLDEQRKEVNSLYDFLSRQQDRLSAFQADRDAVVKDVKAIQTALPALEQQVKELSEPLKANARQEKRVLEGMNSILNYNVREALRAAKDVMDYAEEDE